MSDRSRCLSRLREIDWDFTGSYSESPFSAAHWHPGRFASQLPAALIGVLSNEGDLVLDPFAGSGTTLVEAQRLLRRSVGIDLNPISCLISEAKTLACSAEVIAKVVEDLRGDAVSVLRPFGYDNRDASLALPNGVQWEKWYTSRVARNLVLLWELVSSYTERRQE